jgi:glycosyltransferase involved in cell wall biosynthesis
MARSYEVHLIAFRFEGESSNLLPGYVHELEKVCARVDVWEMPYPRRSLRWWVELALNPFYYDPFSSRRFWSPNLFERWECILKEQQGALLHVDGPDLAHYGIAAKGFIKVMNHHNCESGMILRRARKEPNLFKKAFLLNHAGKLARLERDLCHQFNVNTVVSELDARDLAKTSPRAHFHVVDNGTDTGYFVPSSEGPENETLIFSGTMDWYPNVSAIKFFLREIWPLLKSKFPIIRLYLAGQNPGQWLVQRTLEDPNIQLVISPPDMRPWLARAAVFICPIIDGGGTRLKLLDAMAMGKPIVSTSIGCEGLRVKHGENILIADTAREFAGEICRLMENEELRRRIGAAGRALVEALYSWPTIGARLQEAYRCAVNPDGCALRASNQVLGAAHL